MTSDVLHSHHKKNALRNQQFGPKRRILIVDDDANTRDQLSKLLEHVDGLEVDTVADGSVALDKIAKQNYSIVITDLRMPQIDGMQLIKTIQEKSLPITVMVTTAFGSIDEAVEAMQLGAYDFLTKPIDVDHLGVIIERALRERTLQDEVVRLREQLQDRYSFHNILSKSPSMHKVFETIANLAHTNTTVLIEGETGTGKEVVASAIHAASQNRNGPLVAVNCAALPENLLDSELFGHEKGAFTGAAGQRKGRFEMAHCGTIFLDEVGDVPAPMQAKLLRVLQERRFERVGGSQSIEVDVRVIAATNRPLEKMVKDGVFREDLFYRLNVMRIKLPPLRERREDIPLLAAHFAQKYAVPGAQAKKFAPQAMEALLQYEWPGNIRQLENAIERACVTSADDTIHAENLPPEIMQPKVKDASSAKIDLDRPLPELLRDVTIDLEQRYIREALQKTHGDVGRCAKLCGMSRRSITAKISQYGIDKSIFKEVS